MHVTTFVIRALPLLKKQQEISKFMPFPPFVWLSQISQDHENIQHVFIPFLAILLYLNARIQRGKYSPQEKPYNTSVKELLHPYKV